MIKIRYCDPNELSPGLHGAAEGHGRRTTVYLLSGLTTAERRAALRKLRLNARMGHCPRLPAAQLALALLADRFRTGLARAGAVFRLHPAGSTVPVMAISGGAIAFLLLSNVSIHVLHGQRTSEQLPGSGSVPVASASAVPLPGASQGHLAAGLGGPGQAGSDTGEVTSSQSGPGRAGAALPGIPGSGTGGSAGSGTSTNDTTTTSSDTSTSSGSATGSQTQATTTTPVTSTTTQGSGQTSSGQTSSTQSSGRSSTQSSGQSGSGQTSSGQTSSEQSGSTQSTGQSSTSSQSTGSSPSSTSSNPQLTSSGSSSSGVCLDVGSLGVCLNV